MFERAPDPTPLLIAILFFLLSATARPQESPDRNWHIRIPIGLTLGMNFAELTTLSGPSFSQGIGSVVALNSGIAITRRERWGFSLEGGAMLDSYNYFVPGASYSIGLLSWRAEGRVFSLFPLSEKLGTHLNAALGFGFTFYTQDELSGGSDALRGVSNSIARSTPFVVPEFGISKLMGRHRMDIALRYQLHLDNNEPAMTTVLSTANSSSVASASGDHLALVVRFHLGFKERTEPALAPLTTAFTQRSNDSLGTFTTTRVRVTMQLWDNAEQDGDTLSVILNGRTVLNAHALTKKKKKLRLKLAPGINTILIVAQNEGSVPPNTASCVLRLGKGRKQILLKTSMKENDVIQVLRE